MDAGLFLGNLALTIRFCSLRSMKPATIQEYHLQLEPVDCMICELLQQTINTILPMAESKLWHGHPVWFIEGNPVVGYSKLKDCIRLLFWSGQSFNEPGLQSEGSFKAAEARYRTLDEVHVPDLERWLDKAVSIQWDYKNLVKRKGQLLPLKGISEAN